ncbi:MAG: YjbH domain-containing protein [Ignavibacteria bacterium]|nr:YjbH domain-containing protein [Ignavibacteria bacterium]
MISLIRSSVHALVAVCAVCVLILNPVMARAQGSGGTGGGAEPRFLVDAPTAGMLSGGTLAMDLDFFQDGGVLAGVSFGVLNRLSIGISYGGSGLIGNETAVFNPAPGFNVRVRPFEEGLSFPALVLGFDSQGKESYLDDLDEYTILSKGFFLAASKNFGFAGFLSVHGGLNYSLDQPADDRTVDFFLGAEKTIGSVISALVEYNSGGGPTSRDRGYMNLGLRWSVGGGFTLGFDLKDLTRNGGKVSIGNRSVKIEFQSPL